MYLCNCTVQTLNVCFDPVDGHLSCTSLHQLWLLEYIVMLGVNTRDKLKEDGNALKPDTTPMNAVRFLLCS